MHWASVTGGVQSLVVICAMLVLLMFSHVLGRYISKQRGFLLNIIKQLRIVHFWRFELVLGNGRQKTRRSLEEEKVWWSC